VLRHGNDVDVDVASKRTPWGRLAETGGTKACRPNDGTVQGLQPKSMDGFELICGIQPDQEETMAGVAELTYTTGWDTTIQSTVARGG
jgi:hypothetical protein